MFCIQFINLVDVWEGFFCQRFSIQLLSDTNYLTEQNIPQQTLAKFLLYTQAPLSRMIFFFNGFECYC